MSGLCGYYALTSAPAQAVEGALAHAAQDVLQAMAAPLRSAGDAAPCSAYTGASAVTVIAHGHADSGAQVLRRHGMLVAIWGRPTLADSSDEVPQRLLALWQAEGPQACSALAGSFALAIIDSLAGQVCLAVDRCGSRPMHYQKHDAGFVFGTSAASLLAHPAARRELDPQALYHYLHHHVIPAPHTAYLGQVRLLPGEYVVYRRGAIKHASYWKLAFDEAQRPAFAALKQDFRQRLHAAVSTAAQASAIDSGEVGAFLSGGTDSSTLAGLLGQVTGSRARTYAIGFDVPGYDEMRYARIAARHFDTVHHAYYLTPEDVLAAIGPLAACCDQPFGNASIVPAYYCAQLARADGVTLLLGGDGGDELFGGNERYARQAIFARYERLPASLRQFVLEPLLFGVAAGVTLAPLRKARSYIEQALAGMPARLDSYNLLQRYGPAQVLTAEFLAEVDTRAPSLEQAACYWDAAADSQIHRLQALDMRLTLADSDLPKVRRACALAGVDVAFPFLDDALVAFSARLAPERKLDGTRLRPFFKDALRDHLPRAILHKRKHGFGLPFGHWLQGHAGLRALAYDSLSDLKARHIVRADFIDRLTGQLVPQHPAYHGTMVWVLMMLEQWWRLQQAPPLAHPAVVPV